MKSINRKKTIIAICIAVPATFAAILIHKAVKAAKHRKYSATRY